MHMSEATFSHDAAQIYVIIYHSATVINTFQKVLIRDAWGLLCFADTDIDVNIVGVRIFFFFFFATSCYMYQQFTFSFWD